MNKTELLRPELELIKDHAIRHFTEKAVDIIPDYIFTIPASSTGKYHPSYALGEGGLLRHIKAAVRIAAALFRNDTVTGKFSDGQKDIIIAALILHDGVKSGITKQTYTVDGHAKLMANHLEDTMASERFDDILAKVCPLIASHMGQWNTDRDGNVHSPLPITAEERFVHMCDYLASRKFIEINFEASI
jgi:hypothetical protein